MYPTKYKLTHDLAQKKWLTKNPGYQQKMYRKYRAQAFAFLGGNCTGCGTTDTRLLELSHKNGDGKAKDGISRSSTQMYRNILSGRRSTEDLELRCANCHILYEYEKGFRK